MQSFPSKVDIWLAAILLAVPLVTTAAAIAVTIEAGAAGLLAFITPAFVLLLFWAVVWPIRYDVEDQHLVVKFGRFRKRVSLQEITRIVPSHNPLSSPALSLNRIRVDYGKRGFILLSHADREGFSRAILQRAPQVEIDERLLPAATSARTTR